LEFNVPFQHKYGYIRDEVEMGDSGHNKHGLKRGGCCDPIRGGGELGPRLTQCRHSPGPRSTSVPSGVFIHLTVLATIDMGRKLGAVPLLGEGGCWSPFKTTSPGSRPTSVPSAILIHPAVLRHNRHGPKIGRAVPFLGKLGPHLTQSRLGRDLPPYQVAS